MATKYNVIVWGDSGGCGYGDFEDDRGGGVPARLEKDFHDENRDAPIERFLPTFHNNSVYGSTALTIRRRFHSETEARRRDLPILHILGIGMNDAMRRAKNNHALTWERRFAAHIQVIAKHATAHEDTIMYTGMPAFDPDKVNPYRGKMLLDVDRARRFESIACDVVRKAGGVAIELFDASHEAGFHRDLVSADGLHPNSDGYDWIYQRVAPVVHKLWTPDENH